MINLREFLSVGHYVFLPSKKNAKVILNINNKNSCINSFELYNPFSIKAKVFKFIFSYIVIYLNTPFKFFFGQRYIHSSKFILEIEVKLNRKIHSSLYYATAKDKVVLQLQDDKGILGYLKFSLNELGGNHLRNEVKAINILMKAGVLDRDYLILDGCYKGFNYCILKNIPGKITSIPDLVIKDILHKLEGKLDYELFKHPRILKLRDQLIKQNHIELIKTLDNYVGSNKNKYKVVYEHGDFAEWNIIKADSKYILFDFEYFEEEGLEYLDLFKFYFQKANLLKAYNDIKIIEYLKNKINLPARFNELFIVFLIKEISIKSEECQDYFKEYSMLNYIILSNK